MESILSFLVRSERSGMSYQTSSQASRTPEECHVLDAKHCGPPVRGKF